MKKKLNLFNNSGFTLMEVMISSGLLSVLVLASMHFVGNQSKDQANLNKMLKVVEWIQIANKIMSEPRACRATMIAKNHFAINGQVVERLYYSDKAKSEIFYVNASRHSDEDGAEVTGMTLQNPQDVLNVGAYKFTKIELHIGYAYKMSGVDATTERNRSLIFPFIAKVDTGTNQIIDCKRTVEPAEVVSNTCDALGGNALDSIQDCDITSVPGLDATDNLNMYDHISSNTTGLSNDIKDKMCTMITALCASDPQYAHLCPYSGCTYLGCSSAHPVNDCHSGIGGTIVLAGTEYICRFNGSSCPAGWSQCAQWSTTSPNSCFDSNGDCPIACSSSGSHAWNNQIVDYCTYNEYDYLPLPGCPSSGKGYADCCEHGVVAGGPYTCQATVTQIGCR